MGRGAFRTLSLLLVLGLSAACAKRGSVAAAPVPVEGVKDAPLSFVLPRFGSGEEVDIAARRGKVVVLDVWATWCDPCIDALPAYDALAKDYEGRGLEVYALSIDEDPQQIAAFVERTKLTLPVLHDLGAIVAEQSLRVQMVPTTFVVDPQGVVRYRHEGFNAGTIGKLKEQIDALLAEGAR